MEKLHFVKKQINNLIGMVILFLGLAFLLRLATERFEVSIQARYVMVALAGVAATFTGWRLQSR